MEQKKFIYDPYIDVKAVAELVQKEYETQLLPALKEFIKIPHLSPQYDKEWKTNGLLQKGANHIVNFIKAQQLKGIKELEIKQDGADKPPLIFVEIEGSEKNSPTVLIYCHFDKQPPMTDKWEKGLHPFDPVEKDGYLYGRGASDDGYANFMTFGAIKICQQLGLKHPRIIFTAEGEEESGSANYIGYLEKLKNQIGKLDAIYCLDSGCLDYNSLWTTSSLRGYIDGVVTAKVLKQGIHSGEASGIIPSSFRILRQIFDRIEDSKTGRVHEAFHVEIPPHRYAEAFKIAKSQEKKLFAKFPFHASTQPMVTSEVEGLLNATWRPTISYLGAEGLPDAETAGGVLRPETKICISMRTPPILNAKKKAEELKKIIEENPPYNSEVTYKLLEAGNGWDAPKFPDYLQECLNQASLNFFKNEVKAQAEGGSIPLMNDIQEIYPNAHFIVTGILGPGNNAHGPNENLCLDALKKFMGCMVQMLADFQKYGSLNMK